MLAPYRSRFHAIITTIWLTVIIICSQGLCLFSDSSNIVFILGKKERKTNKPKKTLLSKRAALSPLISQYQQYSSQQEWKNHVTIYSSNQSVPVKTTFKWPDAQGEKQFPWCATQSSKHITQKWHKVIPADIKQKDHEWKLEVKKIVYICYRNTLLFLSCVGEGECRGG